MWLHSSENTCINYVYPFIISKPEFFQACFLQTKLHFTCEDTSSLYLIFIRKIVSTGTYHLLEVTDLWCQFLKQCVDKLA